MSARSLSWPSVSGLSARSWCWWAWGVAGVVDEAGMEGGGREGGRNESDGGSSSRRALAVAAEAAS